METTSQCWQCLLPQIDKYLYSQDPAVVAGALLGVGIINSSVQARASVCSRFAAVSPELRDSTQSCCQRSPRTSMLQMLITRCITSGCTLLCLPCRTACTDKAARWVTCSEQS